MKDALKKGDIIIIAMFLALSLMLMLPSLKKEAAGMVIISVNGVEEASLPIDTDAQYIVSDGDALNIIEISGGEVYMSEASCPDEQCVRQGSITDGGEVIVCLPNRVTVRLDSNNANDTPDAVAY